MQKLSYCSLGYFSLLPFPYFPDILLPSPCLCLSLPPLLQPECYCIFHFTMLIIAQFICLVHSYHLRYLLPTSASLPIRSFLLLFTHRLCRLRFQAMEEFQHLQSLHVKILSFCLIIQVTLFCTFYNSALSLNVTNQHCTLSVGAALFSVRAGGHSVSCSYSIPGDAQNLLGFLDLSCALRCFRTGSGNSKISFLIRNYKV